MTKDDDLRLRTGLAEELLFLARKHPRPAWPDHPNVVGMASFWLQRHAFFREMGRSLVGIVDDYREGRMSAPDFARLFAPRLRRFLGELEGHHHVEDEHYFPLFAAAEPRLARGFEILDRDHHAIHEGLLRNAETANAFLEALRADVDELRFRADNYAAANLDLVAMLARHLDDEEDLIIPLILDRGEGFEG